MLTRQKQYYHNKFMCDRCDDDSKDNKSKILQRLKGIFVLTTVIQFT